jgi:hypothetical protein
MKYFLVAIGVFSLACVYLWLSTDRDMLMVADYSQDGYPCPVTGF